MRDFARAVVIVMAFLLLLAEAQRNDEIDDMPAQAARADEPNF